MRAGSTVNRVAIHRSPLMAWMPSTTSSLFYVVIFSAIWSLALASQAGTYLYYTTVPALGNLDFSTWAVDPYSFDPCVWPIVACDQAGAVTEISLSDREPPLNGTFVIDHQYFPKLTSLKINNNQLHGTLPWRELGQLPELDVFDASNNRFTGNITFVGHLSNLTTLNVKNNNLTGTVPQGMSKYTCDSFSGNPNLSCPSTFPQNTSQLQPPPAPAHPPVPMASSSSNTAAIIAGVASGVVVFLIVAAIFFWLRWRRMKRQKQIEEEKAAAAGGGSKERWEDQDELEDPYQEELLGQFKQLIKFPLTDLEEATNNFSEENLMGEGGYGRVFRGQFGAGGPLIAVKCLKRNKKGSDAQFLNELATISRAVHKNLVRLEGFCVEKRQRILVFPYLPRGSVSDYYKDGKSRGSFPLAWPVRKKIAVGTAEGLAYMHTDCTPKLIHRDVKAPNILLSEDFEPVVADFGLATLIDDDNSSTPTAVKGTIGHIAPEVFISGQMSEKSDVFGFGIFLIELISGITVTKLPIDPERDDITVRNWVVSELQEGRIDTLVDDQLISSSSPVAAQTNLQEVQLFVQIGLLCLHPDPIQRPSMTECVTMLQGQGLADRWQQWRGGDDAVASVPLMGPHEGMTEGKEDFSMGPMDLSGPR